MFDSSLFGKRLKELRECKGLSHQKLSEALHEKYGIKISTNSLLNYEVTEKNHTKYEKNAGMRTEYLYYFSDFYGVSSDYLLGFTNEPCKKQTAVDELNLPSSVVSYLRKMNNEDEVSSLFRNTIIAILSNSRFWEDIIPSIYRYINVSISELLLEEISYECQSRKYNVDSFEFWKKYTREDLEALNDEEQAVIARLYETGKINTAMYDNLLAINSIHGDTILSSVIPFERHIIQDANKLRITSELDKLLCDIVEIESEKVISRLEDEFNHSKY